MEENILEETRGAENVLIISRNYEEDSLAFKNRVSVAVEQLKNKTGKNVTKSPIGGIAGITGAKKYIITVW